MTILPKKLQHLNRSDATHRVSCRHCIGPNQCSDYSMDCIPLGVAKNGKMRVLVFGDRNWKGRDESKRIRYVPRIKVFSKP